MRLPVVIIFALALIATVRANTAVDDGIDFTGFWKSNCNDPFGVQIRPYGDSLYTIDFCGPGGGCNQPQNGALATPIQGDPHYEVVSATEIREKIGDTVYGVLYKCTSDTNPILKYSEEDIAEGNRNLAIAIGFQVGYFLLALALSYALWIRVKLQSRNKKLLLRCAILAFFFSPSMLYMFPFATPSFALLAVFFQLYIAATGTVLFLLPQVAISVICMLIVWIVLVGCGVAVRRYREPIDERA